MIKKMILFLALLVLPIVSANTVVLVSDNLADYNTALDVANVLNATVITTEWGIYNESLVNTIISLNPDKVIIIGGPLAVVDNYTTALENAGISVERIGGHDRYQTNAMALLQYREQFREKFGNNLSACVCHGFDDIALNESLNLVKEHYITVLTNGVNLTVNVSNLGVKKVDVIVNPICPFCNYTKLMQRLKRGNIVVEQLEIPQNKIKLMLQNRLRILERRLIRLKLMGINDSELENKIKEIEELIKQNKYEEAYKLMIQLTDQQRTMIVLHFHPMGYGRAMGMNNAPHIYHQNANNSQMIRGPKAPHRYQNVTNSQMGRGRVFVDNNGNVNVSLMHMTINNLPKQSISEEEKEGLIEMREEEKLARDVYLTLYNKWKLPIFKNIAESEQTHTDSIKYLLNKYNISDPVKSDEVGKFSNPKYQELYQKLVEEGNKSVIDALKVGATIEDLDIADLQYWLNRTDNEDIKLVYENLMKGSRNHMRAFVSMLQKYGANYTPQYISKEEYEQIINSPMERGRK